MKKNLMKMLLCLTLVAAMFVGFGAVAFADGNTQTYTVTKNDGAGVAAICKAKGIDFAKYSDWIRSYNKLNGQFAIVVGQKLELPANNNVALADLPGVTNTAAAANNTANTTNAANTTTSSTTSVADSANTQSYTLKNGDNVSSVCKKLGIDFGKYRDWITAANNISNYNNLKVGRVIYLPANNNVALADLPGVTTTAAAANNTANTTNAANTTTSSTTSVADSANTQSYTLKNGDNVSSVCKKLGIDFGKYRDWITAANNISNYNNLKVGRVIYLPANNNIAVSDLPGGTVNNTAAPASSAGTAATSGNTAAAAASTGDSLSGYLVNHTVQAGETVYGICQAMGINFTANSDRIAKLNNLTNFKSLRVGQTLVVPSTSAPASGDYSKIVAHKVVSGDTVMALCKTYGINYGTNEAKLKALNNTDNLGSIKVGQTVFLPVPASTAVSGGTAASGNTQNTGTATANNSTPNNVVSTSNGSFYLQVNGVNTNDAKAGDTVKIITQPDPGAAVKEIIVYKAGDMSTQVSLNEVGENQWSFVMPSYAVSISVTFAVAGGIA